MKYEWKAEKRRRIVQEAAVIIIIFLCIFGRRFFHGYPGNTTETWMNYQTGSKNNKSFRELAAELETLGFSEISNEQIDELTNSWDDMPEEFKESLEKLPSLLSSIGSGNYNYDTWEWTPTSEDVYSFDVEVLDCSKIYTNFLIGIKAISKNEFSIEDIVETVSDEDFERGTGTQTVNFKYNGTRYSYDAKLNYDWFDVKMINFMNQVLKEEKNPKRLYFMDDGYQECIIFYCTKEWADQFKKVTGYTLECKA